MNSILMNSTLMRTLALATEVLPSAPHDVSEGLHVSDHPPLEIPTFPLLINGEDIDTGQYEFFPYADKFSIDPKGTFRVIRDLKVGLLPPTYQDYIYARYCVGTRETNHLAMHAAAEASREFKTWPLSERIKILRRVYELLLEQKEQLMELMVIEGHPAKLVEWEFSGMEQVYRKQCLDFYKDHLMIKVGNYGQETCYWRRNPDGVVCVSPPKNAPCSSSIIAGFALLGGNTLIVKPPLRCPIATMFLWRNVIQVALQCSGAPPGTLNIILGHSKTLMDEWITSPLVNDIFFTGDTKTGLDIGHRAYQHGKKAILELAGNDILFVWKDAAIDHAVSSLLDAFLGSTQICMVPKKALIHEDIYDAFERAFVSEVKKLKIGPASDPDVSLSPVVKIREFFEFLDDALGKGAALLCGGTRVTHDLLPSQNGNFIMPAVVKIPTIAHALEMRCFQEENFFPLMPLVRVSASGSSDSSLLNGHPFHTDGCSKDEVIFRNMIAASNNNKYGLRASVWVNCPHYIEQFMHHINNTGLLRINSRHIGFSPYLASHGGPRGSGGPYGEMNYIWEKTTHLQGISLTRTDAEA